MKTMPPLPGCLALITHLAFFHAISLTQLAAEVIPEDRVVRLAVLEATRGPVGVTDREARGAALDLLTARLTATAGFELVERGQLNAVFQELSLSATSLSKAADAVQVGQMVKADWFLMVSFPPNATNAVLGKILDASTGIIRNLQMVPLKLAEPTAGVESLTAFVVATRKSGEGLNNRLWVGFGAFEDLGLFSRYPNFTEQMRTAMELRYAGTRVSVVERSQMSPLMEELRLSMDGFTAIKTTESGAQPAFVLVDGLYQAFRDDQSKLNLVLRMEWVGGRKTAAAIKELPGVPLEAKVSEALDRFLAESPAPLATNSPTRRAEAKVQLSRGRELARISDGFYVPAGGVSAWSIYPRDRAPRVREAVNVFESALFLDPENLEARFCLAGVLADPVIDQLEKARDIWREIAATTTNLPASTAARSALAGSYVDRDNVEALRLMTALRNGATNDAQLAQINSRLGYVRTRLADAGQLAPADILEFAVESWRTECRLAERRVIAGRSLSAYMTFSNPMNDFYHAFSGSNSTQARREYIGSVVSNLTREFPRLEPYLIAAYVREEGPRVSPSWTEWHKRTLTACEEHPENIPDPVSYYTFSLMNDLQTFTRRKDYEWADRVTRMFEKHGRRFLRIQNNKDELDFLIGDLRRRQGQWREAIVAFERIGPRQLKISETDEFWGKAGSISGTHAAQICRQHMALTAAPKPTPPATPEIQGPIQLRAPAPVQVLPGPQITFAVDHGELWLADRIGFYRYRIENGKLENLRAPINPRVRRVLVHQNKVWFATAEGLYELDPRDGTVVTNTVNNGLLMPSVTALVADGGRLWTGFGGNKEGANIGGIGYLNLADNRFVGLMSDLPASLATTAPQRRTRDTGILPEGAQRRYITGLSKTTAGPLWISTTSRLMSYDGSASNVWNVAIPRFSAAMPANLEANADYVVVPCYEPGGWGSGDTNFGGLFIYEIHKKVYRRLTNADGLPNNKLYSAVIDGPKAWVGGEGFVAMVDLAGARVEKICPLASVFRVGSMAIDGNWLWFASGPGLYRLPRNGDTGASPDGSKPTSTQDAITDIDAARELLKQRDEVFRLHGSKETPEFREMTARYHSFVRREARHFPLLESPSKSSTNHFMERIMNKESRGYDGFRFRSTLGEPADFGWILAYEGTASFQWLIVPVDDTEMVGFTDGFSPKIAYTNAPWTGLDPPFGVKLQFLHDGQLAQGKEYIIWFNFRENRPTRFFIAFDLFPAAARHRSRSVLEGTFGLKGTPIGPRY
jgi:hypothetical protein